VPQVREGGEVVQQQSDAEVEQRLECQVDDVGPADVPGEGGGGQVGVQALLPEGQRGEAVRQAEAGEEPEQGLDQNRGDYVDSRGKHRQPARLQGVQKNVSEEPDREGAGEQARRRIILKGRVTREGRAVCACNWLRSIPLGTSREDVHLTSFRSASTSITRPPSLSRSELGRIILPVLETKVSLEADPMELAYPSTSGWILHAASKAKHVDEDQGCFQQTLERSVP
jgi:hypothetical protein